MKKLDYRDMRRELAQLLDIDEQLVRCNDMTGLYCVKTGPLREVCTIADSADEAAGVLRGRL